MNKKAYDFLFYPLVFGLALGLGAYFVASQTAKTDTGTNYPGELSSKLLHSVQEAEKLKIYIDQAAKHAAQKTVLKLAETADPSARCNSYAGYQVWAITDNQGEITECYPENFQERFEFSFLEELDDFLKRHPTILIPQDNYETDLSNNLDIIGKAKKKVTIGLAQTATQITEGGSETEQEITQLATDFIWPVDSNIITSCVGTRDCETCSKNHNGVDIKAKLGDPVRAIADGSISFAGGNYGTVKLKLSNGLDIHYMHNSKIPEEILNKEKVNVNKGEVIAFAGGKGPKGQDHYPVHLHFEIYKGGNRADPLLFYDRKKLNLKYQKASNCVYNSHQYANTYQQEILQNII